MPDWSIEFLDEAKRELLEWPLELRAALNRIFDRIEMLGLERVRESLVKHVDGKLWEMRPSGKDIEGRALYVAISGKRVMVVLAFVKKAQKTPHRLIELALRRAEQAK